jgi:hypothetical protein
MDFKKYADVIDDLLDIVVADRRLALHYLVIVSAVRRA